MPPFSKENYEPTFLKKQWFHFSIQLSGPFFEQKDNDEPTFCKKDNDLTFFSIPWRLKKLLVPLLYSNPCHLLQKKKRWAHLFTKDNYDFTFIFNYPALFSKKKNNDELTFYKKTIISPFSIPRHLLQKKRWAHLLQENQWPHLSLLFRVTFFNENQYHLFTKINEFTFPLYSVTFFEGEEMSSPFYEKVSYPTFLFCRLSQMKFDEPTFFVK